MQNDPILTVAYAWVYITPSEQNQQYTGTKLSWLYVIDASMKLRKIV